jgi:UDPglucose--hexose-1-phosphate uridylyltransferase
VEPASEEELASCPFCEGREDQTPPEVLAIGPPDRRPNTPGWTVRVVPNKYPAFEHHEVVIHSPRHVRSFADLTAAEIAAVAEAWSERGEEAWAAGFAYTQFVINEGRGAGASLPHSHSQLVWLEEHPPLVQREVAHMREGPCVLCDLLETELKDGRRVIAAHGPVIAFAPYASRSPYEFWVAGEHWGGQPGYDGGTFFVDALELIAATLRRLRELEGPVPLNIWLHSSGHWHLEVVPRFSIHAGFELGAGIYLNSLAPEDAAARLRGTDAPPAAG